MKRIYLDYNATTPLSIAAQEAMIEAMDIFGNPSSIHFEGRLARKYIESARDDIREASGASNADIVFTSGATEVAALALNNIEFGASDMEHPSVLAYRKSSLPVENGVILAGENDALQLANSEHGLLQKPRKSYFQDAVQVFGKIPYAFSWSEAQIAMISAHKIGGPKGVGAMIINSDLDIDALIKGGGQEGSRRAGTENLIGIMGFAGAAKNAQKNLLDGNWDLVEKLRDYFEDEMLSIAPELKIWAKEYARIPNTSSFSISGWSADTQVMQMDLAGFSISAGSACSSGKITPSKAVMSLGASDAEAQSTVRVSLGLQTTKSDIQAFITAWGDAYRRWKKRQ